MAAPAFALEEEHRAEGNAARVIAILAVETHPSRRSLPAYQLSARLAFEAAAANTEQPAGVPR